MGLIGGIARTAVAAGTWTAVSNTVSRRQAGRWASEDQSQPTYSYRPPPPGRYQRPMFQHHAQPQYVPAPQQPQPQYMPAPRQPQPPYAPAPQQQPQDAMGRRLAQLQQLGALKAQGVLSEAEFEAQKRQILATTPS